MVKSYRILYKGVEIGTLDTDRELNLHRYTHNEAGLQELEQKGLYPFCFIDYSQDTGWIKPIPFLANKIRNCECFAENPKVIGYHTDSFRLILIE